MQSSIIVGKGLCEKCRKLLNACFYLSSIKDGNVSLDIGHYETATDFQASADGGCRGCQIFWMHMICAEMGDYDMITLHKSYLQKDTCSNFSYYMALRMRTRHGTHGFGASIGIYLLDKMKSYPELSPILRLASENIDDEVRTLMQTTIRWIDKCSQNHEKCRRTQSLKGKINIVPTRLINVQSSDKGTAKLVDTKELPSDIKPTYLILSYCWGMGNQTAKTTRSNLGRRKHKIMVCDLPKTIQDAITVTRVMGVRYLWVDALCIIQPDNDDFLDDWNTEAAQMGSYYSNALFCISAICASDSSEGFLRERQSARYSWRKEECIQYEESFFSIAPPEQIIGEPNLQYMPLMRRAWALQERILSTQRLHWSVIGLLWECDSGLFQENQPLRNLRQQPDRSHIGAITDNFMRTILSLPKEEALGMAWLGIVDQYSGMELTHPTDRLAAIHGIAHRLSLQHNVEYFGGMFNGFYSKALTWRCMSWRSDHIGYVRKDFPSWSWASAASFSYDVEYLSGDTSSKIQDFVRYAKPVQSISLDEMIDFRDCSKRKLLLKAPLVSIKLGPHQPIRPKTSTPDYKLIDTIEGPIWRGQKIYCEMDCYMESPEPSAVTLLICNRDVGEVVRTAPDSRVRYKGLVLRRSEEDGPNAFVRLGLFGISIPWSEEEGEGCYLNDWETDICLF